MPFGLPEINKILPTGYVLGEDLSYLEAQKKDDVKSAELVSGCLANLATSVSRIQVMPAMQEVCGCLALPTYHSGFQMDIFGYNNPCVFWHTSFNET